MYQIYSAIGSILLIFGLISSAYFLRHIFRNKLENTTTLAFFEALTTVFIGICFIYASHLLSNTELDFTFTNNHYGGETFLITTTEDSSDYQFDTITPSLRTETSQENETEPPEIETTTPSTKNKNDEFLTKYQNFFKDIINQKMANKTVNRTGTIFFNNRQYRSVEASIKIRNPKQIIPEVPEHEQRERCFSKLFVIHALLIYSFLLCIISLLNFTVNCNTCSMSKPEKPEEPKPSLEEESKPQTSESTDTDTEKNEASAPVGPLFQEETEKSEPNMELFRAKSVTRKPSPEGISKVKLLIQVFLLWLIPILSVIILYNVMKEGPNVPKESSILDQINFNNTRANPHILSIIQKQPPYSEPNERSNLEINKVIENVYKVVRKASENLTKSIDPTPSMYDIVSYLNNKNLPKINITEVIEECFKGETETVIKVYFLMTFILIYFVSLMYSKLSQVKISLQDNASAKDLNLSILSFGVLWLPSIFDVLFRMYVMDGPPNTISHLSLGLGSFYRIFNMFINYKHTKKTNNFVTPA